MATVISRETALEFGRLSREMTDVCQQATFVHEDLGRIIQGAMPDGLTDEQQDEWCSAFWHAVDAADGAVSVDA